MDKPMLRIAEDPNGSRAVPHLLPCQVRYDGAVGTIQTYWRSVQAEDGTKTSYFRGRKLRGTTVKIPDGYKGVVLMKGQGEGKDPKAAREPSPEEAVEPERGPETDEEAPRTEDLETKAAFNEVVVWGHESTADPSDPYVRMGEWLALAEQIHSYPNSK